MLKKSNTSRYSSSLGAGVRAGVTESNLALWLGFGCREMRKSRSNAQRRILRHKVSKQYTCNLGRTYSASIFTVDGVTRSPFSPVGVFCESWYSERTRDSRFAYRVPTSQY
jgi:hypothetical protein